MPAQGPFDSERAAVKAIARDAVLDEALINTLLARGSTGTMCNPPVPAKWFEIQGTGTQYAITNPSKSVHWVWVGQIGGGLHLLEAA